MGEPPANAKLSEGASPINAIGRVGGGKPTNRELYGRYSQDPGYKDVVYDEETGGVMATHVGHNITHNPKDKLRYFGNMTKEDLEKECQREVVRMGGSAIYRDENIRRADGTTKTALDAVINGYLTDIRSVTERGTGYRNQLEEKNGQLKRWNRENPSEKARTITLYFHDKSMYDLPKVRESIRDLRNTRRNGRRVRLEFKRVLVVVRGGDEIIKVNA